jgi:hypothetical protein
MVVDGDDEYEDGDDEDADGVVVEGELAVERIVLVQPEAFQRFPA